MIGLDLRIDRRGEIVIEELGSLARKWPKYAQRAIASALKSEGHRLKDVIRQTIREGGPAGAKWPKLNPHTGVLSRAGRGKGWIKNFRSSRKGVKKGEAAVRVYRDKEGLRRRMLSKRIEPLLKLAGGVRYKYDDEVLSMGFLMGDKYRGLVRKHAAGYSTPVTPKGRRRAFALGFPLKASTSSLITPARPLMEPVFAAQEATIRKNVVEKARNAIDRYITGGTKL